jgi:hypothetical protein
VRLAGGSAADPAAAAVFSPHGIRLIRSVTAIAGWSATWHPRHGPPVTRSPSAGPVSSRPSTSRRAGAW